MAKRGTEITVSRGRLERLPRAVSPFADFDRLFDDFFGRRWLRPFGWERPFGDFTEAWPNVDVIDRDEEVVVRAELPGFRREDLEVSVSGNTLTLSGETRAEDKEEEGTYYRAEITRGAFSRTLALPAEVEDAKARATMRDGVLELTLPKVERARRRTLTIE